ncbi:hypothetical protein DKT68_00030, partial [Micromonospora acroterricola]
MGSADADGALAVPAGLLVDGVLAAPGGLFVPVGAVRGVAVPAGLAEVSVRPGVSAVLLAGPVELTGPAAQAIAPFPGPKPAAAAGPFSGTNPAAAAGPFSGTNPAAAAGPFP